MAMTAVQCVVAGVTYGVVGALFDTGACERPPGSKPGSARTHAVEFMLVVARLAL